MPSYQLGEKSLSVSSIKKRAKRKNGGLLPSQDGDPYENGCIRNGDMYKSALPSIRAICACGRSFRAKSKFHTRCPKCAKRKSDRISITIERCRSKRTRTRSYGAL